MSNICFSSLDVIVEEYTWRDAAHVRGFKVSRSSTNRFILLAAIFNEFIIKYLLIFTQGSRT